MKKDQSRLIWGAILILAGILFTLQEFNILGNAFQLLWLALMAAGSAVFIWIYFTKKEQWWAIIPGLTLLGLSLVGLESLLNIFPGFDWAGAVCFTQRQKKLVQGLLRANTRNIAKKTLQSLKFG